MLPPSIGAACFSHSPDTPPPKTSPSCFFLTALHPQINHFCSPLPERLCCSKCCAGPRHRRQRGRQQLPVLGLACPLPSRSSSVLPSSLPLTFGHDDRDAQISSMPYRLGNALITMHATEEKYGNYHAAPGEKNRTKEQNTRKVVS